jgi:hypothetical protein
MAGRHTRRLLIHVIHANAGIPGRGNRRSLLDARFRGHDGNDLMLRARAVCR